MDFRPFKMSIGSPKLSMRGSTGEADLGQKLPRPRFPRSAARFFFSRAIIPIQLRVALLLLVPVLAGAASFTASLDRASIRLGESAVLSLTFLDGQPDRQINLPDVEFLEFAGQGQSQSVSFVNGRQSYSLVYKYGLTPIQSGDFTIPPISVSIGGRTLSSPALKLNVLPRSAQVPEETDRGLTFVELVPTAREVYVGQPFRVEVRLYFQAGEVRQLPELASDGFTFTDLDHTQRQVANNGKIYHLITFPKLAVPVKAGNLKLGPAKCPFTLVIPKSRDFFGRIVGEQRQVAPVSEVIEINVLPLPTEGRPAEFEGAVGRFKMDVQVGPTNLVEGDPITLSVSIAGNGVLENVSLPSFQGWTDFKVYPPNSTVDYQDRANFVGIKTFEQVVVPQKADVPVLPAFAFHYFDPHERRYKALEQAAVPLTVAPAAAANTSPVIMVAQTNQNANTPRVAMRLVHIKPHLGAVLSGRGAGIWALPVMTFVAWIFLLTRRLREDRIANNPRLRRRLATDGVVASGLAEMRKLAEAGNGEVFYRTLAGLLQERLGERLDLPASGITESVIAERLVPAGVDGGLCDELEDLFGALNQARYAPSNDSGELKRRAESVEGTLKRLREVEIS